MITTEAYWDTATLGVPTYEILLEKDDSLAAVLDEIKKLLLASRIYCVLKIPCKVYEVQEELTRLGFLFNECQLCMQTSRREFANIQNSMGKYFTPRKYRLIDSSNAQNLLKELDTGIFTTDRIALNPHFGLEKANLRYKKWIQNCLDKPEYRITESLLGGIPVGFGMDRLDKPLVTGLLGANYKGYEGKLSYINGMYDSTSEYFSLGYDIFRTYVSSNNIQIIKVLEKLGFHIENSSYVFTLTKV